MEHCKEKIADQQKRRMECEISEKHTRAVVASIKDSFLELLLKFREVDELAERPIMGKVFQDHGEINSETLADDVPSSVLLKLLQEALRVGLMASGQMTRELEQTLNEDQLDIKIPIQSPTSVGEANVNVEQSKRTPFPPCYVNLLANRGTGAITITANSPGQPTQIGKRRIVV